MNKFYSMLGLCRKAGKLLAGSFGVEKGIVNLKVCLVVISADASDNTKKKFINLCNRKNIPYLIVGNKKDIGKSIGKGDTAVIGITDVNLSNKLTIEAEEVLTNGGE
ncbi:L7Ae/L30e/S12e/Gadd45 family ribosomal protein [Thermoanaerobacterium butyriciformans]|uniref:Ribosomal protein L7Ae-like RNA K-turn-binding protein n=1 Tax=Thermoanaerobacterium butyriciformans TaxID=1702242 RepID=A0ABS4NHL9_9THEO|nr:ribosomal L7Ae/L30e/S12e/Gadd45 family protein [Thermoanaerobacterium butyriciformans]MBP2073167.1 ribosomal protein L7Ae-like RNA K-turn-binding protein [Thermoanaerobacterium butyriciformans]